MGALTPSKPETGHVLTRNTTEDETPATSESSQSLTIADNQSMQYHSIAMFYTLFHVFLWPSMNALDYPRDISPRLDRLILRRALSRMFSVVAPSLPYSFPIYHDQFCGFSLLLLQSLSSDSSPSSSYHIAVVSHRITTRVVSMMRPRYITFFNYP